MERKDSNETIQEAVVSIDFEMNFFEEINQSHENDEDDDSSIKELGSYKLNQDSFHKQDSSAEILLEDDKSNKGSLENEK